MVETLNRIDQRWLLWLNGHHSVFFDRFMYFVSDKYVWIPFYIFLAVFLIWKYRRNSVWIFVSVIVLILLSDQFANFLKEGVRRYRPCKDPEIGYLVHIVNGYCRSSYGFVSGHAANSFALATFLSLIFRNKWATIGLFIWAAMVSFSRVYLGVHYPGDVLGGAVLGVLLAWGTFSTWRRAAG
jgi:undecaprenyl-diphosphatase